MIDFIKKTVHPPGIAKPDRLALFSAIGGTAEKVRLDALKAFNAHFPYLADSAKLEEHAGALIIPRLPEDTEKEFRGRVTAASFFLMRAGERACVLDQLRSHFGDRFILKEEFLQVYVRIIDLEEEDRAWVRGFLGWILNPNIELAVSEWFRFADEAVFGEYQNSAIHRVNSDFFYRGLCCGGRFLCDQGTAALCDGFLVCGGSWNCDDFQSAPGTIFDTVLAALPLNGAYRCDGSFDCSGYIRIYDPRTFTVPILPADGFEDKISFRTGPVHLEDTARINALCGGSRMWGGSNCAPAAEALMAIRIITPVRCGGSRTPSCITCGGTWTCDGSHTCFEGWYCSGDLIEEEVI